MNSNNSMKPRAACKTTACKTTTRSWREKLRAERAQAIVQSFFQSRRAVFVMQSFGHRTVDALGGVLIRLRRRIAVVGREVFKKSFDGGAQRRTPADVASPTPDVLSRAFARLR